MKRVLVFSLHDRQKLHRLLVKHGFTLVKKKPDFVLVYGGDGSVLMAERLYPSVPKLLVKRSGICRKCDFTFKALPSVLMRIKSGKFKIRREMKLEAKYGKRKLLALNEIQLHTRLPIRAVRFSLQVAGRKFENLIGDGLIVSTPFGASAYYYSAGGRQFKKGIGIALNNLHNKKVRSFVVSDKSIVRIKLDRDNALLAADNDERVVDLKPNAVVTVKKSKQFANFIEL